MHDSQIHFEVYARRNQNATLALEMATEDRARAMAYAEELLLAGSVAVRVSKEVLDAETGEYSSATILAKGVAAPKKNKNFAEDAGPPCVTPQDLYSVHARQRIVRLLEGWLGRYKATPFELLHRPDLAEKLEASGTDLQHAIQKIAIPEAQDKGVSVHEIIRAFNGLIERAIERLIKDGRKGHLANFKTEPFAVACARLLDDPEAHYRLGGGVAAYLADATTWRDKIDRLLDLADGAPADAGHVADSGSAPKSSPEASSGAPTGLSWSVSKGIVSGVRQLRVARVVQFDAPVDPGNSGGPLIDANSHQVIGVVAFLRDNKIGFAILADEARKAFGAQIPH